MTLAVDFSASGLGQTHIDGWKAAGVRKAIAQYSSHLVQSLDALDGQGLDLEAYVYLYFPRSPWDQAPADRVGAALQMCLPYRVGTVWNDAEEPSDQQGPSHWAENIALMWDCINLIRQAGREAGIYTNKYRYEERFGTYMGFAAAGVKLWNADYLVNEQPVPDFSQQPTELRLAHGTYGGWTVPAIWQWHNTTSLEGFSVDLNYYEEAPVPAPLPDYRDVAAATASAVHFLRNGFSLADLSEPDREAVKALAALIP